MTTTKLSTSAKTLGDILIQKGLLTPEQLAYALQEQKEDAAYGNWYLLGEVLVRWGLITHEELMVALDEQYASNESLRFQMALHPSVSHPVKRGLDLLGAAIGLGLTLLLLPVIALAIYLEDHGPIFFSQYRVGLRGKQFKIWKFRSMVPDADRRKLAVAGYSYKFFDLQQDNRITLVGKVLRKTQLDEFPQFWNVLKGEMSLVGTRPPTLDEVKHYSAEDWQRMAVKPGLTGLWQVSGQRRSKDFAAILALDLAYQKAWHPLYDLGVILQTIIAILFRRKDL
jgi:lipopolysaccharide/colanic/teichoic acid biosynthesis glycosyltransferase